MFRYIIAVALLVAMASITGCAGSAPSASFKRPLADNMRLCSTDDAKVVLQKADEVPMGPSSLQNFESRLQYAIDTAKSKAVCVTPAKRVFTLKGTITRYESGNSFARLMLAGLGQIHIDGDFSLYPVSAAVEPVAEFSINKTFAWGGVYGASTRIEDIEPAFFQGISEAIVKN